MVALPMAAQVCRLSVAGLNRDRKVAGDIATECPNPLHSAPFGNWGVTSNFGQKRNSHQFDGWCHDSRVCDNDGNCRTACRDGWYEWNSCTVDRLYKAPNCTVYNAKECTEQATTQGINVHGTQLVEIRVRCPIDTNNDGVADTGGCGDVQSYAHGPNFMSVYELDPLTGDELVQTAYFPPTPVALNCTVGGCPAAGSEWRPPERHESPATPAKVWAEMATVVNSGTFVDSGRVCRVLVTVASTVSAASFGPTVAADSLATLFGTNLSDGGSTRVFVTDSAGIRRQADSIYTSARQINFVVPAGTAVGEASLTVEEDAGMRAVGTLGVAEVAPALFTADGSGRGRPAALVQTGDRFQFASEPIDLPGETYLILFGTGMRARRDALSVRIAGVAATVVYAGPQPEFAGLDQVNVRIPALLAGRGEVALELVAGGVEANTVTLFIR